MEDIREYDAAKAALERGDEELIPSEVVYALPDGQNPIRVWREYREMTQGELASAAGISVAYLSQLEAGKRAGSTKVLKMIAAALNVTLVEVTRA